MILMNGVAERDSRLALESLLGELERLLTEIQDELDAENNDAANE